MHHRSGMHVPSSLRLLVALSVTVAVASSACGSAPSPTPPPTASPSPTPTAVPATRPPTTPTPSPSPSPSGLPTGQAYEHLSGVPVAEARASAYPYAVMLDDSPAARPQAGLSQASIVWQAPAEGGIPRYMAVFQSGKPGRIGPVRSARLYFVRWASEAHALYGHVGGPPPLLRYLNAGKGGVVNADAFRWAGTTFNRMTWRRKPHNSYTSGRQMTALAKRLGVTSVRYDPATWQRFRDGAPEHERGADGSTITVRYTSERVDYRYDRAANVWRRSVDGSVQRDPGNDPNRGHGAATDGPVIAPTTVVVMVVPIRRSSSIDGPAMGRLEADAIGDGKAWVFADGHVVAGRWEKRSATARTRFYDAGGDEVVLPRGQMFIQVISKSSALRHTVRSEG